MLHIQIKKKTFGSKIILEDIDVTISKNGIYGVAGKNGEGKTTLFKCITALTNFDGTILNDGSLLKNNIAFIPTEVPIYDELTAVEFADFYKELLNLNVNNETNLLFEIPKDKLIKTFSTGMKKKAYMNAVFQEHYSVYIFDEPFNGLDLESNYLLMNYIRQLSKTSVIFIASHILEILYKDCEKIYLIKAKKIKEFQKHQFSLIEEELF